MNNNERKVLILARGLVKAGWCRGSMAKNRRGVGCSPTAHEAVRFCAHGAIKRAAVDYRVDETVVSCYLKRALSVPSLLGTWNDAPTRTKKEVLDLFDKVIGAYSR